MKLIKKFRKQGFFISTLLLVLIVKKLYSFYKTRSLYSISYETSELIKTPIKNGGEAVAEALSKHGVSHLFTLTGGHISAIIVACKQINIKVIDVRNEANAVYAAEGISKFSRTGEIGVVAVTAGGGLTQTISAVKTAYLAQTPLVLLGGASSNLLKGRGSLQDTDQQALMEPHVKWQSSCKTVRDIIPTLEKAFAIAKSLSGPVFVELPIDILYPEETTRNEIMGMIKGKGFMIKLMKKYLDYYISNIFKNMDKLYTCTPLIPYIPKPSYEDIKESLELISKAKRPIIVCGSQVVNSRSQVFLIADSLNKLGIPVYLGGLSRGLLGVKNKLHMKHKRSQVLKETDLVILLGATNDFRLKYGMSYPQSTTLLSVNLNSEDLNLNRKPTYGVIADPGLFLIEISKYNLVYDLEWLTCLRDRDDQVEWEYWQKANVVPDKYINPLKLCQTIDSHMSDRAITVVDGGDIVAIHSYISNARGPLTFGDAGVFGCLSNGAGYAMAAKLLYPDIDVWLIWGDGACGYSCIELDTFARHGINVICVVGNNGEWAQITRSQIQVFKDDTACILQYSRYHDVAKSLECSGYIVDKTEELDRVFKAAVNDSKNSPVLINALISSTDFRKDSISV